MTTIPTHGPPARRRACTVFVIVMAVALALPACGGEDEETAEGDHGTPVAVADAPEWIEKIYPPPDSETSVTRAVQVVHTAIQADRQVRLKINGADVTAYALGSDPGYLVYDMDDAAAPVQLTPGEHTAEVQLMRRTPGSGEGTESYDPDVHEVIESYSWEFTIF